METLPKVSGRNQNMATVDRKAIPIVKRGGSGGRQDPAPKPTQKHISAQAPLEFILADTVIGGGFKKHLLSNPTL